MGQICHCGVTIQGDADHFIAYVIATKTDSYLSLQLATGRNRRENVGTTVQTDEERRELH